MKFSEIQKINRMPFDEDWLSIFCYASMRGMPDVSYLLAVHLLHWYFVKFNEIYGTNIVLLDDSILNYTKLPIDDSYYDWMGDIFMEYDYNCREIFAGMAHVAGFEVLHVEDISNVFEEIWDVPKKIKKKQLSKEFKENAPSWVRLLWKNFDNIKESAYYLESGDIYILRNEKMGYFLQCCEKYRDIIEEYLSEEAGLINQVINELMKPLYYENVREEGQIGKYQYLYFDVGSNGYEYLGFGALNLNWIINCYVFPLLMDDFTEKVQQLSDICPELRNRL